MRLAKISVSFLVAISAGCSFAAFAQESGKQAILGLQLGSPLGMSECSFSNITKSYRAYEMEYKQKIRPCWMQDGYLTQPGTPLSPTQKVKLLLPPDSVPHGVRYDKITGQVVSGNLESVTMLTTGEDSQESILALLVEKYGKPTTRGVVPVQNRMGASFQSITAEWKVSDITVEFSGMAYRIDTGLISVETNIGRTQEDIEKAKDKAEEPKF